MANRKVVEKGIAVNLWLDKEMVKELDRLAGKVNLSRSRFIRNLIASGLQDAKIMDDIGLLTLMRRLDNLTQSIKAGVGGGQCPHCEPPPAQA